MNGIFWSGPLPDAETMREMEQRGEVPSGIHALPPGFVDHMKRQEREIKEEQELENRLKKATDYCSELPVF
jgi:hypothetical protein